MWFLRQQVVSTDTRHFVYTTLTSWHINQLKVKTLMMNLKMVFTGNEGCWSVGEECKQGKINSRISSLMRFNILRTKRKSMRINLSLALIIAFLMVMGLEKGKAQIANPGTAPVTMLPNSDPPSFSPGRLVVLKTTTTVTKSSSPITTRPWVPASNLMVSSLSIPIF